MPCKWYRWYAVVVLLTLALLLLLLLLLLQVYSTAVVGSPCPCPCRPPLVQALVYTDASGSHARPGPRIVKPPGIDMDISYCGYRGTNCLDWKRARCLPQGSVVALKVLC